MANTNSISLNGASGQYLSRPNDSVIQNLTDTFTIEFWLKSVNFGTLISRHQDNGNRIFVIGNDNQGHIQFQYFQAGQTNYFTLNCGTKIDDGNWHHVAIVYNHAGSGGGAEIIVYIDTVVDQDLVNGGSPVSLINQSQGLLFNATFNSAGNPYGFLYPQFDDVRFWSIIRSQSDIATNWKRELAGNESGLVAYWKFNNDYSDTGPNGLTLNVSGLPTFSTDVPFQDRTTTSTSTSSTSTSTTTTTTSTSTTTTTTSTSTSTTITNTSTSTSSTSTSTTITTTSTSSSTSTSSTTTLTTIPGNIRFTVEKIR